MNIFSIIRIVDFGCALLGLLIFSPLFFGLFVCGALGGVKVYFSQIRVGYSQRPFRLLKFRTMAVDTLELETHLVQADSVTPLGHWLRRYKIDELPPLRNVLVGDMSLVGPRPGLTNQKKLINLREKQGVFSVRPGITGLSQITGVDMSTPDLLANTDAQMIAEMSLSNYFKYILLTVVGKGSGDRIKS